jgi:hypothetical protein
MLKSHAGKMEESETTKQKKLQPRQWAVHVSTSPPAVGSGAAAEEEKGKRGGGKQCDKRAWMAYDEKGKRTAKRKDEVQEIMRCRPTQ